MGLGSLRDGWLGRFGGLIFVVVGLIVGVVGCGGWFDVWLGLLVEVGFFFLMVVPVVS